MSEEANKDPGLPNSASTDSLLSNPKRMKKIKDSSVKKEAMPVFKPIEISKCTNTSIFKSSDRSQKKNAPKSSFLEKMKAMPDPIKVPETVKAPTADENIFRNVKISYYDEYELIEFAVGIVLLQKDRFIFKRPGFVKSLLDFSIKDTAFKKDEDHLSFVFEGKTFLIEFIKDSVDKFLSKIERDKQLMKKQAK